MIVDPSKNRDDTLASKSEIACIFMRNTYNYTIMMESSVA